MADEPPSETMRFILTYFFLTSAFFIGLMVRYYLGRARQPIAGRLPYFSLFNGVALLAVHIGYFVRCFYLDSFPCGARLLIVVPGYGTCIAAKLVRVWVHYFWNELTKERLHVSHSRFRFSSLSSGALPIRLD